MNTETKPDIPQHPFILTRYFKEVGKEDPEQKPQRVRRRFHNDDVTMWRGKVHVDDIQGWVQNVRILHFLSRWRANRHDLNATPTTEDIYEMMVEADREAESDRKRPFQIERIAENIARNGIQEPVILFLNNNGRVELWDGNRRYFGTKHIMRHAKFAQDRARAQWIPADVYLPSGDPADDERIKHSVLTEMNFIEKDHIPWPAFVKAGEIYDDYQRRVAEDPHDPKLKRAVKDGLAKEYGLNGWRVADRWIKMYKLAEQFKEYHEEDHDRSEVEINLRIQDKFEYFDELSKPGVWGALEKDPDARDDVFDWLWDGKFQAFPDVRMVPAILSNSVARVMANQGHADAVRDAIKRVHADDPVLTKDKQAAGAKIAQFANWLDSFKREDYKQVDPGTLQELEGILRDIIAMLKGLQLGQQPLDLVPEGSNGAATH